MALELPRAKTKGTLATYCSEGGRAPGLEGCVPAHSVKATGQDLRMRPAKTRAELRDGNKVPRALLKLLDQNKVSLLPGFLITQANKFHFP